MLGDVGQPQGWGSAVKSRPTRSSWTGGPEEVRPTESDPGIGVGRIRVLSVMALHRFRILSGALLPISPDCRRGTGHRLYVTTIGDPGGERLESRNVAQ
jgi:hypothetical protein